MSKIDRNAKTGKFVVKPSGRDKHGRETWVISGDPSGSRTVVTSSSSAKTIDAIKSKHKKALKRLADR